MPIVSEVPPLLTHIIELRDMHTLLSCGAISGTEYMELILPVPSTSEQALLKAYLALIELETSYLTDYIELSEYHQIHIINLANVPAEIFAQS